MLSSLARNIIESEEEKMNKLLQGYLLLDTVTSKELKKKGVVDVSLNSQNVKIYYDGDTLSFDSEPKRKTVLYVNKGVEIVRIDDIMNVPVVDGNLIINANGETITINKVASDFMVCEKEITNEPIKDVLFR